MNEEHVTIPSDGLSLEALLAKQKQARGLGVVCHPHPQYGGSMHNNVVEAILEAMWGLGFSTLRFNFRGVGASEGEYSGGEGEARDAAGAVSFMRANQAPAEPLVLAGYSFGAMVGLRAGANNPEVTTMAGIALPVAFTDLAFLKNSQKPVALIAGDRDEYCPEAQISEIHEFAGGPKSLDIIHGADHFFGGYESELTRALTAALKRLLPNIA